MAKAPKEKKVPSSKRSPHVPDQYLGFSLQTTRFLSKLLFVEEDWSVSLEVFEDVGTEGPTGERTAQQTKSTHAGNPVSDHAVDLWKTFSNWIDSIKSGELDVFKTSFEIFVSNPKDGVIVSSFSDADTKENARIALLKARTFFWGESPNYPLKKDVCNSIGVYLENFFGVNEEISLNLIKNFTLICGSGSPIEDSKKDLGSKLVSADILDDVFHHCLGWVKAQIDRLIEQGKPAIISAKDFRLETISFIRRCDRQKILLSVAKNPTPEEIERELPCKYIQQLEIIDAEYDDKISAVISFLKASVDRAHWSVKGWVTEASFTDFESQLRSVWQNLKIKTLATCSHLSDVEKGKILYADCQLYQTTLEGLVIPPHFTPGSFQVLSNNEIIGWHPDYFNILKEYLARHEQFVSAESRD